MSIIEQYTDTDFTSPIEIKGPAIINFSIGDREQQFLQALYGNYLTVDNNNSNKIRKYQQYYTIDHQYDDKYDDQYANDPYYITINNDDKMNNEKIRLGKSGMYESSYFIGDSSGYTIIVPENPPASLIIDVIRFYS